MKKYLMTFLLIGAFVTVAQAQQAQLSKEDKENFRAELRAVDLDLHEKIRVKRKMIIDERNIALDELNAAKSAALVAADPSQHHMIADKYTVEIRAAREYYANLERTAKKELLDAANEKKLQIKYRYLPETRPQIETTEILPQ